MKNFSEIMENNKFHNILDRKNFVMDEELKKRYDEEDIPYMGKMDETHVKSLDEDERCLGFFSIWKRERKNDLHFYLIILVKPQTAFAVCGFYLKYNESFETHDGKTKEDCIKLNLYNKTETTGWIEFHFCGFLFNGIDRSVKNYKGY